ncbi:hypothetical protein AXG93_939s1000 [Marchantia polymorpha subsp. ruderalis]|uniref:Reverse transcriptase domain-containing protein n=1 Tax=Marchantia polymorpha subsp. ruderalis TaxID=1480154 RepID=A0A176VKY7_MARPO|nr:hypothetical protein AXG93_939s1000 [Marchantia polymorpha subsp. ruderalis]
MAARIEQLEQRFTAMAGPGASNSKSYKREDFSYLASAAQTGESLLAVCLCLDPLQSCFLVRARVGVTLISGVVLLLCAVDRGLDLITGWLIYVSLTSSGPVEDRGGFTRSGLRYRLPSPISPVVAEEDQSVADTESSVVISSSVPTPLIWDMDGMYRAVKGPRRYSDAVGIIELDDFIHEFDTLCYMQFLHNPMLFTPFFAWKGLFQHLEGPPMDDYHEFGRDYAAEIDAWRRHWSPNYLSITQGGVGTSGGASIGISGGASSSISEGTSGAVGKTGTSTSSGTVSIAGGSTRGDASGASSFTPIPEFFQSEMESDLIRSRTLDLLEAELLELSHGEYASATVMQVKKDVHGNYTDRRMCGDYHPINQQTKSDKYAMSTPKEIFDVVDHVRIFSTLDLRAKYHQLPIWKEDKTKTAF